MTQKKIIDAHKALSKLYEEKLPIKEAYKVFQLKKKLDEPYQFQLDKEKELFETWHVTVNDQGQLTFQSEEDANGFIKAMEELGNMETGTEIFPVRMDMEALGDVKIAPEDMEALSTVITFETEE